MSYNPDLLVPFGYDRDYRPLWEVRLWLLAHHHPEYVRRLLAWFSSKNGMVGPGGGWRDDGTQPNLPGFAPEGRSFHQNQKFSDGFIGACAVDVVAKDGPDGNLTHDTIAWVNVPTQGSAEAKKWGLHANVGVPGNGESWHIQPIEIDGWESWIKAGSPAPRAGYPLPTTPAPTPTPTPAPSGGHVLLYRVKDGDSYWKITTIVHADGRATTARVEALQAANGNKALHPGDLILIPGRVS